VRGRAEIIASGLYEAIADDATTRFELDRAEVSGQVTVAARATAELALEAVRSAGPDSAAGIDGDSILVRVKRASIGGRGRGPRELTYGADLGLVADPWIAALGDYPLRTLGLAIVEAQGLVASSDLGLSAHAALGRIASLTVAVTNGEGAHQPERNRGKSTSVVVSAHLAGVGLHLYGRDGSVGPGSTRSHRAGAAVSWHHPRAAAGADLVQAWGVGDRPDVLATTVEAWADVRALDAAGVMVRFDRVAVDGPTDDLQHWRATGALWYELARGVRVVGAVQVERASAGAIAGVPTATDATRILLTAQGSFEGSP